MPRFSDELLNTLEKTGNRLPHPTLLFVWLCALVLLASALAAFSGLQVTHPVSGESVSAVNLMSASGVQQMLTSTVSNFTQFAPVGTVLVAMLGLGVAERSGLIGVLLAGLVRRAEGQILTFLVVFSGVMSSLAADAGYVVLIPLAAMIFQGAGRHPLAGIAAAFAGVSGGYSANLLLGPFDALLSGISTEAAQIVEPGYTVSIAANYWFMMASVLLVSVLGTWVTHRWTEPRLAGLTTGVPDHAEAPVDRPEQSRGLWAVGVFSLLFIVVLLSGLHTPDAWLRSGQSITTSPFMKGIVVVISLYALICGVIYGFASGRWRYGSDVVHAMEQTLAGMAGYLVLMFFAAQFVAWFSWSQLGLITAVSGADLLTQIDAPPAVLLLVFIFIAAFINLFVGSGSAKWALLAPVFVPMLMLVGIAPEVTQVAFRIGDSSTNIITPLMPYFGVVLAFAQTYRKDLGMGTVMAMMLPYSLAFLFGWSALLLVWMTLGWALGV
jgi:aminobenzoyl-glutamate transport protein